MSNSLVIDTDELIPGALVIGETGHGVTGTLVPASGTHGPGYAYDAVIQQPGYGAKEYRATLDEVPAGVTLVASENTAFTAKAADGTYEIAWTLYEDGVSLGSTTFNLKFGP